MSEAHDSTARSQDLTARAKSMRVSSSDAPLSPVTKRPTLSPVTPGTAPLSGTPRATEPNGKTTLTVASHSGDVCDLVPVASRSNHGAELTYGDEKNVCYLRFSLSLRYFRYRTYHRMSALFCRLNFQTNSGNFRYFFVIFSLFLGPSLLSTAPKDSAFCESLGDVAFLALKFDILRASCTRVFDTFVEFISVSTCVKCI